MNYENAECIRWTVYQGNRSDNKIYYVINSVKKLDTAQMTNMQSTKDLFENAALCLSQSEDKLKSCELFQKFNY